MNSIKLLLLGLLFGFLFSGIILLISTHPVGNSIQLLPPPTQAPEVIHISGAVTNPGVYLVPINSRVADAISLAGGLLKNADTNNINLALIISDGDKISIPLLKKETPISTMIHQLTARPTLYPTPSIAHPLNINSADIHQLDQLPGIGELKANQIIIYREKNGPFVNVQDIQKVNGIGLSLFNQIKDLITINP